MNRASMVFACVLLFISACSELTPAVNQQASPLAPIQLAAASPTVIPTDEPTKTPLPQPTGEIASPLPTSTPTSVPTPVVLQETARQPTPPPELDADTGWSMFRLNLQHIGSRDGFWEGKPTIKWQFATGDIVESSPAVVDGIVYVGTFNNHLFALDAETGIEVWRFPVGSLLRGSPTVFMNGGSPQRDENEVR